METEIAVTDARSRSSNYTSVRDESAIATRSIAIRRYAAKSATRCQAGWVNNSVTGAGSSTNRLASSSEGSEAAGQLIEGRSENRASEPRCAERTPRSISRSTSRTIRSGSAAFHNGLPTTR
jgi:hypothetical protein